MPQNFVTLMDEVPGPLLALVQAHFNVSTVKALMKKLEELGLNKKFIRLVLPDNRPDTSLWTTVCNAKKPVGGDEIKAFSITLASNGTENDAWAEMDETVEVAVTLSSDGTPTLRSGSRKDRSTRAMLTKQIRSKLNDLGFVKSTFPNNSPATIDLAKLSDDTTPTGAESAQSDVGALAMARKSPLNESQEEIDIDQDVDKANPSANPDDDIAMAQATLVTTDQLADTVTVADQTGLNQSSLMMPTMIASQGDSGTTGDSIIAQAKETRLETIDKLVHELSHLNSDLEDRGANGNYIQEQASSQPAHTESEPPRNSTLFHTPAVSTIRRSWKEHGRPKDHAEVSSDSLNSPIQGNRRVTRFAEPPCNEQERLQQRTATSSQALTANIQQRLADLRRREQQLDEREVSLRTQELQMTKARENASLVCGATNNHAAIVEHGLDSELDNQLADDLEVPKVRTRSVLRMNQPVSAPTWAPGDEVSIIGDDLSDMVQLGMLAREVIYSFCARNSLSDLYRQLSHQEKNSVTAFTRHLANAFGDATATACHRFANAKQVDGEDESVLADRLTRLFRSMRAMKKSDPLNTGDRTQLRERFISAIVDPRRRRLLRQLTNATDDIDTIVRRARELRKIDEIEVGTLMTTLAQSDKPDVQDTCPRCGRAHHESQCRANAKAKTQFNKQQRGERKPIRQVTFDGASGQRQPCHRYLTRPEGCPQGDGCPFEHIKHCREVVQREIMAAERGERRSFNARRQHQ